MGSGILTTEEKNENVIVLCRAKEVYVHLTSPRIGSRGSKIEVSRKGHMRF